MLSRAVRLLLPVLLATLAPGCGGSAPPPPEPPGPPEPAMPGAPPVDSTSGSEASSPGAEPVDEATADANTPLGDATEPSSTPSLSDGETRTMTVIQQTVLENRERFRACYDAVQAKKPELQGDLTLYFVLDSEGRVKEAALNEARSTLKDEQVVKCAVEEVRKLQFPASSKGLETKVNYPFNFNPK